MSLPGKPQIFNVSLANSAQEYSQVLPERTSKLMVKCRTSVAIQMGWNPGESSTNYLTIPSDQTYWDDDISAAATLYLQSATSGVVAEIQAWTGA